MIEKQSSRKTDSYYVQELHAPPLPSEEYREVYEKFARRILWVDASIVDSPFQVNTAWYFSVPEKAPIFEEHVHEYDELVGFFGSDSSDPYNLNGEFEIWIDREKRILTNSSMIFIPSGVSHMPMFIKRIEKPIFHFSICLSSDYDNGAYQ